MTTPSISDHELEQCRALLFRVFGLARFENIHYLDWLYRQNPDGVALINNYHHEGNLCGHIASVPNYIIAHGKQHRIMMALHSSVAPEARGQGVFSGLINSLRKAVRESGTPILSGIGNKPALAAWTKMGFPYTGNIPVQVFLMPPVRRDAVTIAIDKDSLGDDNFLRMLSSVDFRSTAVQEPYWYAERLKWRLSNPASRYWYHRHEHGDVITTIARHKGIKVAILLKTLCKKDTEPCWKAALQEASYFHKTPVFIHAGWRKRLSIRGLPLPGLIRPSILCSGLENYGNQIIAGLYQLDGFEFLDFDAY